MGDIEKGSQVEGRWRGGEHWYPAIVVKVAARSGRSGSGPRYQLRYDDDGSLESLASEMVRLRQVKGKVRGKGKGKGKDKGKSKKRKRTEASASQALTSADADRFKWLVTTAQKSEAEVILALLQSSGNIGRAYELLKGGTTGCKKWTQQGDEKLLLPEATTQAGKDAAEREWDLLVQMYGLSEMKARARWLEEGSRSRSRS